ncbi:UPF0561 protein C2orf68 homolog [Ciona intestinalis]
MSSSGTSEEDEPTTRDKRTLDMNHGFLYHIRRNQFDRDNYDKKVKNDRITKKAQVNRNYRPENKHYQPPSKRGDKNDESAKTDKGKSIFKLEYTSDNGKVHSITVKENDEPLRLAKRLVNTAGIPPDLLETLEWKISQEQLKRKK